MKPSEALASSRAAIASVVEPYRGRTARVSSSVLHGRNTAAASDLDILIDPPPVTTLLARLPGVSVGVVPPNALPDGFRPVVLAEARPV